MKRDPMGRRYIAFKAIDELETKELATMLREAAEHSDEDGGCSHWHRRQLEGAFQRAGSCR